MSTCFDPATGTVTYSQTPPDDSWLDIPAGGTLIRTIDPSRGGWTAERVHHTRLVDHVRQGWEEVTRKQVDLPDRWYRGSKSAIRFGFAALTKDEQRAMAGNAAIVIVLPDEPGLRSACNCPGSRYYFQLGMVTGGVPDDYVIDKLLTHRVRMLGIPLEAALTILRGGIGFPPRGWTGPTPWQEGKLQELVEIATCLSDDLAEIARVQFGDGADSTAWNRRKQWQANKGR